MYLAQCLPSTQEAFDIQQLLLSKYILFKLWEWSNVWKALRIAHGRCQSHYSNRVYASSCAPLHSESRQTEMLESGAEKGLLGGHTRRRGGSCPERPELPERFWQSIFKGQVRRRLQGSDQLVHGSLIGWWWDSHVLSQGFMLSGLGCAHVSKYFLHLRRQVVPTCKTAQETCIRYCYLRTPERS